MNPRRILLPIDIANCPLEVFCFVNRFAKDSDVTVTLLHVVTLNVVPMRNGIYEELCREAEQHLEKLAKKFVRPALSVRMCVRAGKVAAEIVAEAKEWNADLIILSSHQKSAWKKACLRFVPGTIETVMRRADCSVTLLQVKTHFDCQQQWAFVDEIIAALNYVGLLKSPESWRAGRSQTGIGDFDCPPNPAAAS